MDIKTIIKFYRPVVSLKIKKEIGASNPDWEDLTNEVLTVVFESLKEKKFKEKSRLGTYIYGITKNVIRKYKYKKMIERKKSENIPLDLSTEDVGRLYEAKENLDLIAEAIKKLDFKYRQILYLYYYQALPRETIARILNLSLNQVDARINYAIRLLKKKLNL
ncbi:sigma-70 family RNA polymerase sigma factor [Candidatus Aminicenantes bacterium AC-335-B20]|jgi:RNA polymerase sigma-70 factor (ECF subfamily)|nr:sigma-70 family RNA polymerase sigma factor [SCandidatus Aminicenantes bacterium Aminicenantia_JdfR_composite]MCP2596448.1 sigma-70 family RNA polymerase sigma factor [Candidatus Aminicenantes bacterium AC-335-G13]MCP2598841.1 sigma-70 family RNA polymerase sigma factor [Candidatus Aminicenantes bacterium AC-335-B20]MCP2620912.1 sigma-70 family RNA polymerase sigma factor [Candidatus Aminicenantes bacterium AC-334-E05]